MFTNQETSKTQIQSATISPEMFRLRSLLEQGAVEEFNRLRPAGELDLSRLEIAKDTNLTGINLSDCILTGSKLTGVNLSGANLARCNLTQTDLSYAKLQNVEAPNATFDRATLNYAVGSDGNFSQANFAGGHMMRATFESCDFTGAKMQLALLQSACFRRSDFTNANLSSARMKETSFEGSCLVGAVLQLANITKTNFSFANMTSASLNYATGTSPKFRSSCLLNADLSHAKIAKPDFSGAFVKGMNHSFAANRDEFLKSAFADKDADPKKFIQSRHKGDASGLIMNIPGTDGELLARVKRDIDQLVGLQNIKDKINNMIDGFQINELRRQLGEPTFEFKQHLGFLGEPGTGKTTIGRHWGRVLKAFGYLEKGHLVEVPGRELIVGKIGQSEEKTREYLRKAMGGILFVDEAHQLAKDSDQDFGKEVIGTIVHYMTNYAGKFVVIFAGYSAPMQKLFKMDVGLQSRLTDVWDFNGYDSGELVQILALNLKKHNLHCSPEFLACASALAALAEIHYGDQFGNARFVGDHLLGKAVELQNKRIVASGILTLPDAAQQRAMLTSLELSDLPSKQILGIEPEALLTKIQEASWKLGDKTLTLKELPKITSKSEDFPLMEPQFLQKLYDEIVPKDSSAH